MFLYFSPFDLKSKKPVIQHCGLTDSLRLAKNLANLGDARTLVIHPASTIFHEFSAGQKQKMGVTEDMVRISVGIEDFEDIKADFKQAMEKVHKGTK